MQTERQSVHRVNRQRPVRRLSSPAPHEWLVSVAGELHDDIGQRLAVLAIELGMLRQRMGGVSSELAETVARLAKDTAGIGSDVHRLAKGLAPFHWSR
jgi:hypothetical protein